MDSALYTVAAAVFALLVAVLAVLILFALRVGFLRLGYSPASANRIVLLTGLGLAVWFGYGAVLSLSGVLQQYSAMPPRFLLLLMPPIALLVWMANSRKVGRLLLAMPETWLLNMQAMRIVVELVLWAVFMAGVIPVQMTFEGMNFDVLAGLLAPVVAYLVYARRALPVSAAVAYNILGLALVLTIVAISVLSAPLPIRVFMNEPANTFVAYLPFVWLPGFVVPLAIAGHVLSLRQIVLKARAAAPGSAHGAPASVAH